MTRQLSPEPRSAVLMDETVKSVMGCFFTALIFFMPLAIVWASSLLRACHWPTLQYCRANDPVISTELRRSLPPIN
jgi:hypothetical protein